MIIDSRINIFDKPVYKQNSRQILFVVAVYDLSITHLNRIKAIKLIDGGFGGGRKAHRCGRRRLGVRAIFVADSKR